MTSELNRRDFIKGGLLATTAGALAIGAADAVQAQVPANSPEIKAAAPLPTGKIGSKLEVSRAILGGNLITYYMHSRDLNYVRDLAMQYNTDAKIFETLEVAERNGINTLAVNNPDRIMNILKKHRKNGGKMQWIICLDTKPDEQMSQYREDVEKLVEAGADAIYLHGHTADTLAETGRVDLIAKAVEIVKLQDIPSGVGGHDILTVEVCEKAGIPNDFYIKTFHHLNYPTAPTDEELKCELPYAECPGFWCKDWKKLADTMKGVKKTWIAFKIMAAGAIKPKDAFQWAFENGGDHILIGMFDWQIAEDVALAREAYEKSKAKRQRPWCS